MSDDNAAKAAHKACVDYNARKETEEITRLRADLAAVTEERDALAARLDLGSEEQSMTKLRIGPFLKKVRQEKQMTLRAVEEATDKEISNAYLSQLESGKIANPSPHVLYTLSLVFGVAYETLMERAGYVMPAPNRLAPVEDEALVEIAAYYFTDGSSWSALSERLRNICRRDARNVIAAIRPHIEAADREKWQKMLARMGAGTTKTGAVNE